MKKDKLHLKAPGNWINDPNGFIYYKGKYHLFYQYFPYATVWGTMHWGHAVSEDLIHWEHIGVALFPTKTYDQNGVFSGCSIEKDGKMYIYYSAVRYCAADPENIHMALDDKYLTSQAMIISDDGYHFDNWNDKREIIPVSQDRELMDDAHTRDPKVFPYKDKYYMLLGSTYKEKRGRIIFFESKDAKNWTYKSQYSNENFGRIVECPDLFPIGDTYVFVGCPMYIKDESEGYTNHAICMIVEFDLESCILSTSKEYQYVDYGLDLYATQTTLDAEGRRVMIGWMRMPKKVEKERESAWNGMMCLPRVVGEKDGHIYFFVHPEVDKFFVNKCKTKEEIDFTKPYRLKTQLQEGGSLNIGGYQIWIEEDKVKTDRSKVFAGAEKYGVTGSTPELVGKYNLDIFVEPNLIEIFVNDGQYVVSQVVYELGEYIEGAIEEIFVS